MHESQLPEASSAGAARATSGAFLVAGLAGLVGAAGLAGDAPASSSCTHQHVQDLMDWAFPRLGCHVVQRGKRSVATHLRIMAKF
jgi:hypothetical protein